MRTPHLTGEPANGLTDQTVRHGIVLARGTAVNAVALLVTGFRAAFTLLVARLLGSAVLGIFGVAWATTDLVSKVTTFGLDTSVMTFLPRTEALGDHAATLRIRRAALALGLTLSLGAAAVGVVLCGLASRVGERGDLAWATAVALLALPGIALYRISNAVSRGLGAMHHDIYSRGITDNLVTCATLLAAIALGARTLAPEVAALAGALASGAVAFACARRLAIRDRNDHDPGSVGQTASIGTLMRASGAICGYDLLNIGLMQIDVIMLGLFVGRGSGITLASVGIYAAAAEAAGTLRKINQAFGPIFTTAMARHMASRNVREAEASFALVARWMLTVLVPALVVFVCASHLIMAMFGPDFKNGASWLAILSVACALNAFVGLGETILTVERPALNLKNAVGVALATVVTNLLLIPRLGPLGAALGMLVPYTVYGVLRVRQIRRLLDWTWPWRALAKPLLAGALASPVALAIRAAGSQPSVELLAVAAFLPAYLFAWRLIGIEAVDREMLQYLLGRRRVAAQA